jgi:hypothetical protein
LRRLLAEGVSNTKQADGEIHEDQLLNFLVNSLDEEVALTLAENAELDAEDIYEVLVGARADGTSVSTPCERSEDAPHENSVLYHLRTKFDLETLEQVGTALLQKDVLDVLPQQVEVVSEHDRESRSRGLSTRGRGTYEDDKPPVFIPVDRGTKQRYVIPAKAADESTPAGGRPAGVAHRLYRRLSSVRTA